jgi:hypothetical protein
MRFGIYILCHHKSWLLDSSLFSLFSQKIKIDYDLHFILIKGSGESRSNKKYFEYYKIVDQYKISNSQLSAFDDQIHATIKKVKRKYYLHEFENDHGLDSGAWLKVIQKKLWVKNDYSLFLMEGFVFTSNTALQDIFTFIDAKKPDMLAAGHEKRFLNKKIATKTTKPEHLKNEMDIFQEKAIFNILEILCKNSHFKKIINNWPDKIIFNKKYFFEGITQHNVRICSFDLITLIKLEVKSMLKYFRFFFFKKKILISEKKKYFTSIDCISSNWQSYGNTTFHQEISPYYFGCSCQHLFSNKALLLIDDLFNKNNFYDLKNYPFLGEIFEIIWGMIPKVLGFEKWFFDGIHRVRKNFITDKREDDIDGMIKYLNLYNNKSIFLKKNNEIQYLSSYKNIFGDNFY